MHDRGDHLIGRGCTSGGSGGSRRSSSSSSSSSSGADATEDRVALSREDEAYRPQQPMDLLSGDSSSNRSRDSSARCTVVEERPPARGPGERRRSIRSVAAMVEDINVDEKNDVEKASERDGNNSAHGEDEEEEEDPTSPRRCSNSSCSTRPSAPLRASPTAVSWDRHDTRIAAAPGKTVGVGSNTIGSDRPRSAPATGTAGKNVSSTDTTEGLHENNAINEAKGGYGDIEESDAGAKEAGPPEVPPGGLLLEDIELVNLHNLSLHKLEGMERLVFLRVADLSGNELHDTTPLRTCACLEVSCGVAILTPFLH